jgi:hypothetical protein
MVYLNKYDVEEMIYAELYKREIRRKELEDA